MKTLCECTTRMLAATLLLCMPTANRALDAQATGQRSSRTTFTHALPALNGSSLTVNIVEVSYGPGAASPVHNHPRPVIGYVLTGAVRSQVKGQPPAVYTTGESFYEPPNGVHLVAANSSNIRPAKFIAIFVCDHHAPLSAAVPGESK
jgi:quercetin dioxygenase-like cupin family protein